HGDVVARAGKADLDAADATNPDVDFHSSLACAIQRVDDLFVDEGADLDADVRRLAGDGVLALVLDLPQQALSQMQRSHEQALELLLDRVAAELVEQSCEVLADLRIGGEKPEVLVDATRLRVVVSRAHV